MIPRYGEIEAPLVIIHGTADRNVPIEQARRLHQAAPNATLIEIPGAGHELMFLHPDDVMEGINLVR
jgi:pimeloyl-ACP methyl ester carboxylesterase